MSITVKLAMAPVKTEDREEMSSRLVTFAVLSRNCLGFKFGWAITFSQPSS